MTLHLLATALALATLTQAQTSTIEVTSPTTQTDPIEVSSRPTDDVPNLSTSPISTTIIDTSTTAIDTNTIPTLLTSSLPTIPISSLSNTINGDNTFSSTPTTVVVTPSGSSCVTVTQQGEPQFTIQTDTLLESPCTYTVFAGTETGSGSLTSEVLITSSTPGSTSSGESTPTSGTTSTTPASDSTSSGSTSGTSAPAMQSGNPANRIAVGAEGLGLAALIGALGLL